MRQIDRLWLKLEPLRKLSAARLRAWSELSQQSPLLNVQWEQRWIAGKSEAYTASVGIRPTLTIQCLRCQKEGFAAFTEEREEEDLAFSLLAKQLEQTALAMLTSSGCTCCKDFLGEDAPQMEAMIGMILLENPDIGN
jgi:hypothetical protein